MEIKLMKHSDVSFIKELADKVFGVDFLPHSTINSYLKTNHAICLFDNAVFIGFCFIDSINLKSNQQYFLKENEMLKQYYNSLNNIVIIKQIAVSIEAQGKGYGYLLLKHACNIFESNTDAIISICWDKGNKNPMKKLLQKMDFKSIKTIPNYWQDDSIIKKYECVICGFPPCNCSAELFELKKAHLQLKMGFNFF